MPDDAPAIRARQVDADEVLAMLEAEPHDTPDDASGERTRASAELRVLAFRSRTEAGKATWLIRDAALVQQVLADPVHYTNEPYAEIGGGGFMLAMDGPAHDAQRDWVQAQLFPRDLPLHVEALAALAIEEASVLPLKSGRFDAVDLAGQAAVRFAARLFGFPQADHRLLWQAMQYVYAGLVHQIIGRHVNLDPGLAWHRNPSNRLRERVKELIGDHRFLRDKADLLADEPAGVSGRGFGALDAETARRRATLQRESRALKAEIAHRSGQVDVDFSPLCARFDSAFGSAAATGAPASEDGRADIVIALMGGIVGNVQTSVAIVLDQLLAGPVPQRQAARHQAQTLRATGQAPPETPLLQTIRSILAAHPPVAFLPRRVASAGPVSLGGQTLSPGTDLILGLRPVGPPSCTAADPALRIFAAESRHDCIGRYIAEPLLARIAAELISLPGLDFVQDPITLRAQRLQRRWGFSARPFWLQHSRDLRLVQQPLRAVMDIREPVALHAAALERVIDCAAPVIEASLRESRHIHFAWFMLIEGGRKLALFTVYDGNFEAYIEYFTGRVGPLFDRLFAHVLDGTKPPAQQRPKDFIARIGKVNAMHPPVANYFFSAYPTLSVADLLHGDAKWRSRGVPPRLDFASSPDTAALRVQTPTPTADAATASLRHARDLSLVQQPLCLVMNVKEPFAQHAALLQAVIQSGAPAIERSLRESRQVHFAWFQLLEEGRKLALLAVHDGEVDACIDCLINEMGELFDSLFDHLEDPPPRPARQHPRAWIDHLRAYRRPPFASYFFSGYARTRVADIEHAQRGRREATSIAPPASLGESLAKEAT